MNQILPRALGCIALGMLALAGLVAQAETPPADKASESSPVVAPLAGASQAASGLRQMSPKERAELRQQLRRLSKELLRDER